MIRERDEDALDAALAVLAGMAPEFDGGLSNHGPMAADALVCLGHGDRVATFIERYAARLEACPTSHRRERVLGDVGTFVPWREAFRQQLSNEGGDALLRAVLPILLPGVLAGAFHGPIRVAHAVRAWRARDTSVRRHELASALAYWACRFEPLGPRPSLGGAGPPEDWLASVPPVVADRGAWLIFERARLTRDTPGFSAAVDGVDLPAAPLDALWALSTAGRDLYLAHRERVAIVYVHAVTGPQAVASLLSFLSDDDAQAAVAWVWQAIAAVHAGYGGGEVDELPNGGMGWEETIHAAVASGDEHAIKLALACRHGHARDADHRWLLAAADAARRLGRS